MQSFERGRGNDNSLLHESKALTRLEPSNGEDVCIASQNFYIKNFYIFDFSAQFAHTGAKMAAAAVEGVRSHRRGNFPGLQDLLTGTFSNKHMVQSVQTNTQTFRWAGASAH